MACSAERLMNLPIRDEYKQRLVQLCGDPNSRQQCEVICNTPDEELLRAFQSSEQQIMDWQENGMPEGLEDQISRGMAQQMRQQKSPPPMPPGGVPSIRPTPTTAGPVAQPQQKQVPPGIAPSQLSRVPMPMDVPRRAQGGIVSVYTHNESTPRFGLGGFLGKVGDFLGDNLGAIVGGVVGFALAGPGGALEGWGAGLAAGVGAAAGSYAQHQDLGRAALNGITAGSLTAAFAPTPAETATVAAGPQMSPTVGNAAMSPVSPTNELGLVTSTAPSEVAAVSNQLVGPGVGVGPGGTLPPVNPAAVGAPPPPVIANKSAMMSSTTQASPLQNMSNTVVPPAPTPAPLAPPVGGELNLPKMNYDVSTGAPASAATGSIPPAETGFWDGVKQFGKDYGPYMAAAPFALSLFGEEPGMENPGHPGPSEYDLYNACRAQGRTDCEPPADMYMTSRPNLSYGRRQMQPVQARASGIGTLQANYGGYIQGPGTETSDSIPAYLSNNEFVMTADAVRGMGNGDINRGAQRMYDLMDQLEERGRS